VFFVSFVSFVVHFAGTCSYIRITIINHKEHKAHKDCYHSPQMRAALSNPHKLVELLSQKGYITLQHQLSRHIAEIGAARF
jgi:hypothetical protein